MEEDYICLNCGYVGKLEVEDITGHNLKICPHCHLDNYSLKVINKKIATIYDEIKAERVKQKEKWSIQNDDKFKWLTLLEEEVVELNKAILGEYFGGEDEERYRKELIQIAVIAHEAIECLDKNKKGE